MAFNNNLHGILSRHELLTKPELVQGFTICYLVCSPPFPDLVQGSRKQAIHIFDIVELWRPAVLYIDTDQLPISLVLIDHAEDTKHLCLPNRTSLEHTHTNLACIKRIPIAWETHIRVHKFSILPSARQTTIVEPDVALAVLPELAIFCVLLDWVPLALGAHLELLAGGLGDLAYKIDMVLLHLSILTDRKKRDVMPEGHFLTTFSGLHLKIQSHAAGDPFDARNALLILFLGRVHKRPRATL
mmetsp:Transcript_29305/g.54025  ORF Transcript_29305/g.54025 Transcript_29305/m.54025 type:complete len:243 (+) Transcript_29305:598-1326(+)